MKEYEEQTKDEEEQDNIKYKKITLLLFTRKIKQEYSPL